MRQKSVENCPTNLFHPDSNLPGCMMPDGGDCCEGYQALLADWRRLAGRVDALEAAMREALAVCTEPKVYRILDVALQDGGDM